MKQRLANLRKEYQLAFRDYGEEMSNYYDCWKEMPLLCKFTLTLPILFGTCLVQLIVAIVAPLGALFERSE